MSFCMPVCHVWKVPLQIWSRILLTLLNYLLPLNVPSDRSSTMLLVKVCYVHRKFFWPGTVVSGQPNIHFNFIN